MYELRVKLPEEWVEEFDEFIDELAETITYVDEEVCDE